LQRCECLGYFHRTRPPVGKLCLLVDRKSI
jgi:hypothetical protein